MGTGTGPGRGPLDVKGGPTAQRGRVGADRRANTQEGGRGGRDKNHPLVGNM